MIDNEGLTKELHYRMVNSNKEIVFTVKCDKSSLPVCVNVQNRWLTAKETKQLIKVLQQALKVGAQL